MVVPTYPGWIDFFVGLIDDIDERLLGALVGLIYRIFACYAQLVLVIACYHLFNHHPSPSSSPGALPCEL